MQIKLDPALEALINPAPKNNDSRPAQEAAPVGKSPKIDNEPVSNASAMESVLSAMGSGQEGGSVHQLDAARVAALLDLDL